MRDSPGKCEWTLDLTNLSDEVFSQQIVLVTLSEEEIGAFKKEPFPVITLDEAIRSINGKE